ncbi:uncharacterized protein LOC111082953 [Drosophila obscura]|uniref:uncharacterized protein LOC111082953 n=1 Tax=Drosophila obscura TaxID=7282 RepID=UPI000B9FE16D|nr:uncharacterized protein LOC111082953 [Drosophila obscura]
MDQNIEIDYATYAQLADSMNMLAPEAFYPPAQMGGMQLAGNVGQQGNTGLFGQANGGGNFGQGGAGSVNFNMNLPQRNLNYGQGHGNPRQIFSNPNPMGFHNDPNIPPGLEDLSDSFRANPNGPMYVQPISAAQYRRMALMYQNARQMLARNGLHGPTDLPRLSGGDASITFPVRERLNPSNGSRGSRRRLF